MEIMVSRLTGQRGGRTVTPESKLKSEVLAFLRVCGIRFFRMQSGKVRVRGGWMQLCPDGTPDILCLSGKTVWLELKQETGKMRKAQEVFRVDAESRGEKYHVIRTTADLEAVFGVMCVTGGATA